MIIRKGRGRVCGTVIYMGIPEQSPLFPRHKMLSHYETSHAMV